MFSRIALAVAAVVVWAGPVSATALATFAVDPPVTMAAPMQTITFRVRVSSTEDIAALQFTLDYNSTVATFQGVTLHPTMPVGFSITNVNPNLPPPGPQTPGANENVLVQISGNGINQSFTGTQDVAIMTFSIPAGACGDSPMAFDTACQRTHLSTLELLPICNPALEGGEITTGCTTDSPAFPGADALRLHNVPNPFNPATTIHFELPAAGPVELRVFDVQGRTVRVLLDRALAAGPHTVEWNGRDDTGRVRASGAYYYRLSTPAAAATRRMLMLK